MYCSRQACLVVGGARGAKKQVPNDAGQTRFGKKGRLQLRRSAGSSEENPGESFPARSVRRRETTKEEPSSMNSLIAHAAALIPVLRHNSAQSSGGTGLCISNEWDPWDRLTPSVPFKFVLSSESMSLCTLPTSEHKFPCMQAVRGTLVPLLDHWFEAPAFRNLAKAYWLLLEIQRSTALNCVPRPLLC